MPVACVARLRPDVNLDGGAWDGSDAEDLQCVAGRGLFALLDRTTGARGHFLALHGDPGGEARPMGWSLFGDHAVNGPEAVGLQRLLQEGLPVAQFVGVYLGGVEDLVQYAQHKVSVYEVRRPDYGLDGVGDDRVVHYGAFDDLLYALAPAHGGQERLPDEVRPDACEVTLQELGIAVEDELCYAAVQDRVPEELQPAVRLVGIGDARVRQRALPQRF